MGHGFSVGVDSDGGFEFDASNDCGRKYFGEDTLKKKHKYECDMCGATGKTTRTVKELCDYCQGSGQDPFSDKKRRHGKWPSFLLGVSAQQGFSCSDRNF